MPAFSVIVPVYNTEKYLRRCVESVLGQTCGDWELILVDDGSTDGSGALCDEYTRDPRVRALHRQNGGPSLARNAGLDAATGTYLCFLDSDDAMEPSLLDRVRVFMDQGADLTVFQFTEEQPDGLCRSSEYRTGRFEMDRTAFLLNILLPCRIGWEVWSRCFRRELVERYHLRFPAHRDFGEDQYFTLCYCAHVSRVESLPDRLYRYSRRADSIMGQNAARMNLGTVCELAKAAEAFFQTCGDCGDLLAKFPAIHGLLISNELERCRALIAGKGPALRTLLLNQVADRDYFLNMLRRLLPRFSQLSGALSPVALAELWSLYLYLTDGFYGGFRLRNRAIYALRKLQRSREVSVRSKA